ncbi:extracellular solute-binding protein [Paenibacillus alkaliterrae]|uniref:extracellular solute-binding protein n=1 Tax=Paenibacillus alkaliterrae TaxID=320909 RepID=UPI001F3F0497|nr:extracellular solute-binding protein [Paenibacillus alkaliterrae]MCF2937966.1 extracellular solute-binding protein [Paenibacillus alkaliterrae]
MKKTGFLLLASALLVSLLAGCSGANSKKEDPAKNDPKPAENNPATEQKEAAYPASFSYWVGLNGNVAATLADYSELKVYKKLEENTGTKVEFKHPSTDPAQAEEQFNLMIASGNYPDVIEKSWLVSGKGPDALIEDGTLIRLNELIDQHAPNIKKYLSEHPEIEKMIKTDSGNIYAFPFIRGDNELMVFFGPIIRQDWLEKLNLEEPATIEEWEKVLTAFRDGDPNGNGKKDEIPYLLNYRNVRSGATNELIGAWGIAAQFYQVNGKVMYGEIQPEYKQFLETMQRWYKEKLIDPDFAATDGKLQDAKVTGDQLGSLYTYNGGGLGKYTDLMKDKPGFKLIGVSHPSLVKGEISALGQVDKPYTGLGAAITKTSKNPEQIVKWLDWGYSEEGNMAFNFGIEGESYEMVDNYPKYTDKITKNPDGLPMAQSLSQYARSTSNGPFIQDIRYLEQYLQKDTQKEALKKWSQAKNEIVLPPITLTAEESKRMASIMGDANTYAEEMMLKFIMGAESLDKFDDFVATMKSFGIDEAVKIQQTAMDRYFAR